MDSFLPERAAPSPDPLQHSEHSPLVIERHLKYFGTLQSLLVRFSPFERLLLYILTIFLAGSALVLLVDLNKAVSTEVPARGGKLIEGAIGTPRFVNPLLAASQSDQDLTMLIYSGLMRATPDGGLVEDLAERVEVSEDGTVYTFHLRGDAAFHDGEPVTADDVIFTVTRAQNPDTKSHRRADWEGVNVEALDERTIVFTLPSAYAPFLENATMGILPAHLWEDIPATEFPFAQMNTNPIGSGPFKVKEITTDATGAPTEYTLSPFKQYALGYPNLTRIVYRIFPNETALLDAYAQGDIESFVAASPKTLPRIDENETRMVRIPLTRVFGVFLNQNHAPVLANASVRRALDEAIDKKALVSAILGGYGAALDQPIPPELLSKMNEGTTTPLRAEKYATGEERIAATREILDSGGWDWVEDEGVWKSGEQTLTITLSTSDAGELVATANAIAESWRAAGISVTVHTYPLTEFNQSILRPRNYDAILFGEIVGRSLDLFAFWHSSQRNDPGLNLSLYTNVKADRALAAARAEEDRALREEHFREFLGYIAEDSPAVFLYAPELAYLVPSYLNGVEVGALTTPAERFVNVHRWYRDTERVWNMFAPDAATDHLQ